MINHQSAVEHKQKNGGPIHIKPSEKGSLHSALGVKQGNKIPAAAEHRKLAAAKKDGNVALEKKLVFAINARGFKH